MNFNDNIITQEYLFLILMLFICICLIFSYHSFICSRNDKFKDPLLTNYGIWDLNGWSLTHIVFFGLLGYFFPKRFVLIMIIGIIWEIVEEKCMYYMIKDIEILNCKKENSKISEIGSMWWFGRLSDVFMDAIGFGIGYMIHQKFKK